MFQGRIVDLTMAYSRQVAGYSAEPARTLEKDGWNASTLHLYSHAGTHMDAPVHFGVAPVTIDQFPPERFMGRAWVVSLEGITPAALIEVAHLGKVAEKVVAGDNLLLRTGWSTRLGTPDYRHRLPRLSEGLARWCVEKKINLVGVEPPSVADVNNISEVTKIHQILLGANILIVEGLCNLDMLTHEKVFLMAFPLKIEKGDGAPARVLAIEAEDWR